MDQWTGGSKITAKRRQVLKIIDWTEPDASARYMKLYRIMLGDKKGLSPEEIELKKAVQKAQDLAQKL